MTLGFRESGRFRPVLAVECDPAAAETYRLNFGDHVAEAPIEDVARFQKVDVVIGGPPCQGFSPLNRDLVGFERRGLWREYLRALRQADPQAFVMENVPELLRSAEYADFKRRAQRLGFTVEGQILNAADYGVPPAPSVARSPSGSALDAVPWPMATHFDPEASEGRPSDAPWRHFPATRSTGLPLRPDGQGLASSAQSATGERSAATSRVPRDGGDRLADAAATSIARVSVIWCHGAGGKSRPAPPTCSAASGRDRPACTIRTEFYKPEKGRYLHPTAHRPITLREAARCMSFPDEFVFPEHQPMTSVGRQIGNAVPPRLARRIAESLAEILSQDCSSPIESEEFIESAA